MIDREFHQSTPSADNTRGFVGIQVFMEMHRRMFGGSFGLLPAPIKRDAFDQGGYCLDAPETLPAGAMRDEQLSDDLGNIPAQITIERSAA